MTNNVVLSIYIATYNRKEILRKKIQELLSINSDEFNIWVLDDKSSDGTYEMLLEIKDVRLHVLRNEQRQGILKDGAMKNWYILLEKCDGVFGFHLNDRDVVNIKGIEKLIEYLKAHANYSGGICSALFKTREYLSPIDAFYNIPYRGSHPTGIVFNLEKYRKIGNREEIFTKKISYIHPHDFILGILSTEGYMFNYKKIWGLADQDSFAKNKSFLYKKGDVNSSWFSPTERTKEFELVINSLNKLEFKINTKKKKVMRIAKAYLYFCTFNYAYYISDIGQTQHYGIERSELSRKELVHEMETFVNKSYVILKSRDLMNNKFIYGMALKMYFELIYLIRPTWMRIKKLMKKKHGEMV